MRAEADPRKQKVKQPFPPQEQEPPGTEKEMRPKPDHGEKTYRGSARLKDRKALITGGDSGIGRAVALAFAREGAQVTISYLSSREESDAKETERLLGESGGKCLLVQCDVQEPAQCHELVERAVQAHGGLD